jgi:hypothetical protein
MERSLDVNNKQLADKLTTELTGTLNYVVSDDIQLFSKDMRLGGEIYIPAVLSTVTSFENENRYITTTVYQLQFRVARELKDDFMADIDTFRASQTTETIGSYLVTKVCEKPIKGEDTLVKGVEYSDFTMEMRWTYSLSKVGTSTVIKVDTVQIPFIACDVVHDISYVSNESSNTGYRLTNDRVVITVPLIVANSKVLSLYQAVNSDAYNQVYSLEIDGNVKSVVLKRGQYTFTNTATVTNMILTFETHYPRVEVRLDNVIIPVTAYMYSGKKIIQSDKRVGDLNIGYATSKTRTWAITFVIDNSEVMTKLQADAYGNTIGITYTLDIGLPFNFTVELADVTEKYTETGDMFLECQFIEVV